MIIYKAVAKKTKAGEIIEEKNPKLTRKINGVLNEYAKKIADKAAKLYGDKFNKAEMSDEEVIQQILKALGIDEMSIDIVDVITPEMIKIFKESGIEGFNQVKIDVSESASTKLNQSAMDYAESHGGELIQDLAGTTEDALHDTLVKALDEGLSPKELSDMIQELGAFGESRADMISRTELAFAHSQGNIEGWKQTGVVRSQGMVGIARMLL